MMPFAERSGRRAFRVTARRAPRAVAPRALDPRSPDPRLGDAIADRRRELGLSRRQLAERAELSYPYVAGLERGRAAPSSASLLSLASALELTVDQLVGAADRCEATHPRHRGGGHDREEPPPAPALRGTDRTGAELADLGRFVREIVREELAAASGRAEVSGPSAPGGPAARAPLAANVVDAVRDLLGDESVTVDDQGDVPVPREGVMLFVRVLDDPPSVLVFCPVLVDLPASPVLLERLNELNEGIRFVRFCATEDGVVVDLELFGDGFEARMLGLAVRAVAGASARFGPELQEAFGGRLFREASQDLDPRRDTAGYL